MSAWTAQELEAAMRALQDDAWNAQELSWVTQADYFAQRLAQATPGSLAHHAASLCLEFAQEAADLASL